MVVRFFLWICIQSVVNKMICIECHQECYTHSTCETCKHAICNDCFGDRLRARCGNCYGAKKYQSEDTFLEEIDEEEEAEVRRIEEVHGHAGQRPGVAEDFHQLQLLAGHIRYPAEEG